MFLFLDMSVYPPRDFLPIEYLRRKFLSMVNLYKLSPSSFHKFCQAIIPWRLSSIFQLDYTTAEAIAKSLLNYLSRLIMQLENLIKKEINKTQLSYRAEIGHTQINRFYKNDVARIDLSTIARLCHILECEVSDLIKYEPAKDCS